MRCWHVSWGTLTLISCWNLTRWESWVVVSNGCHRLLLSNLNQPMKVPSNLPIFISHFNMISLLTFGLNERFKHLFFLYFNRLIVLFVEKSQLLWKDYKIITWSWFKRLLSGWFVSSCGWRLIEFNVAVSTKYMTCLIWAN